MFGAASKVLGQCPRKVDLQSGFRPVDPTGAGAYFANPRTAEGIYYMKRRLRLLSVCLGLVLSGCPEPGVLPDIAGDTVPDTSSDGGDGGGGEVGPQPGQWDSPAEGNEWRLIFNFKNRVQGTPLFGVNELWLSNAFGQDKQSITDLASLDVQDPPLSCEFGCSVSDTLRWVSIATGPPTQTGFSFRIGSFTNANLDFKLVKDLVIADKVDFKFAANRLFHTTKTTCLGQSCQYDLEFRDLDSPGATTSLQIYPPAAELEQSTYKGHFKVSPDGEKLILLNTTIRSVTVHLYKVGTGLVQLDFLCKFGTQGNCQGTGSEYQDTDPVAISPDGKYGVFFTFSGAQQRINVYDLEEPSIKYSTVVASVPSGSYIEKACDFGVLADWQWQRVVGDPVFTPDGSEIIFLTETDCAAANGTKPVKVRRDLVRIRLATLLSEKPLAEEDVFSITKNPPMGGELGQTRDNVLVEGFRISPDGATIAFSGTPMYSQNGDFLSDSSSRARNDRELYRARLDAKAPSWTLPATVNCDRGLCQITNDLSWEVRQPRIVPLAPTF